MAQVACRVASVSHVPTRRQVEVQARSIPRSPAPAVARACQRLSGHTRGLQLSLRKSTQAQRHVASPLKVFSQQPQTSSTEDQLQ
eukprot:9241925-Pyramimonas_sp.AAC.1